jgi:hypothetical protein
LCGSYPRKGAGMNELHKIAFDYRNAVLPDDAHEAWQELEQYVKQLINNEREACAKLCEEISDDEYYLGRQYADMLRARGQI